MLIQNNALRGYTPWMDVGLELASLPESEGGWAEYFDADAGLEVKDDYMRASAAVLLENCKRDMFQRLRGALRKVGPDRFAIDEAVRTIALGSFSDHIFPVIRASVTTNAINDLVSVQPTTKHIATIVFLDWIYGTTKGTYVKGQKVFDALTGPAVPGDYASEDVTSEPVTVVRSNTNATIDGTLAFHDGGGVRPGTVQITDTLTSAGAGITFQDDGNGGFVSGGCTLTTGTTINYTTGAFTLVITGDTFTDTAAVATYRWDSEGSDSAPQVDVQITHSTVETRRYPLIQNYSQESAQNVMAELGMSLEPRIVEGAAGLLNYETAYRLIKLMWGLSSSTSTFSLTVPNAVPLVDHFRSLSYHLTKASNAIWSAAPKAQGTFCIVDEGGSNVVETLPSDMWNAAPPAADPTGLHYIGTIKNTLRVYKFRHLSQMTGASAYGNILMGWKGSDPWEAGVVWSPFNLMYTTDPLTTANFVTQRGMASRYAMKVVNPNVYRRITIGS